MMNDGSDSDNYYLLLLIYQLFWRWIIIMTGGAGDGDFHDQFSLYVSQYKLGRFLTLTHDQKMFDTWQNWLWYWHKCVAAYCKINTPLALGSRDSAG